MCAAARISVNALQDRHAKRNSKAYNAPAIIAFPRSTDWMESMVLIQFLKTVTCPTKDSAPGSLLNGKNVRRWMPNRASAPEASFRFLLFMIELKKVLEDLQKGECGLGDLLYIPHDSIKEDTQACLGCPRLDSYNLAFV